MSFITDLVLHRLKDHLTEVMQTSIPQDDLTRAQTVKIGRFQENPLPTRVYLAIQGGSLDDPDLVDGIVTIKNMESVGLYFPPREVGGGQLWWRRGSIRVGCFFIQDRLDEETAASTAYEVMARLLANIENVRVNDLIDSYGEQALAIVCFADSFAESGGPPSQYIWRGTLKFQILTERP